MAGELKLRTETNALIALITCPNQESAEAIASSLVGQRAAACVNIIPGLTSVYSWKGEICKDQELLLMVKTMPHRRQLFVDTLKELHPYEEPELLFLPVDSGSESYLDWLNRNTVQEL